MFKKITSFIMLFSFVIMVVSGVMLFISPFGRLSMMIRWEVMGLDKMDYQALHLIFMLVFTIAGIFHIFYNFKAIKSYFKNKSKKVVVFTKEFMIASVVTLGLFYATVNHVEPLESFVKMNKSFNNYWIKSFNEKRIQSSP
ncbi:MAG: DUF4405 domain-containing protein [Campylobacterota bacterium]|nr:DUF4405 domain-containing protein [Campylobacterota bacterium]